MAFAHGGRAVVFAAGSFLVFADATAAGRPRRVKTGLRSILGMAVTPDGRTVVAAGRPGEAAVEVYDVAAQSKRAAFDFGVGPAHAVAVAPDGCTFAVAGDRGLVVCDLG